MTREEFTAKADAIAAQTSRKQTDSVVLLRQMRGGLTLWDRIRAWLRGESDEG
jgi:hypothetical protein